MTESNPVAECGCTATARCFEHTDWSDREPQTDREPDNGPPLIPIEYRTPWGNTIGGVILALGIAMSLLVVALAFAHMVGAPL